MAIVADASIALCWFFAAQRSQLSDKALIAARTSSILVPGIWWYEVRNILIVNERKGTVREPDTRGFLHDLSRLTIALDHAQDEKDTLRLARAHRLTVYDAAYLELAIRAAAPLATLNSALAAAARAEGAPLFS